MLLHVDISDLIRQHELHSHFGKRLLRKWSGNEYFSIYFVLIQFCVFIQNCTNCPFELQMLFSQNDATQTSYFSGFVTHIFRVKHATELCDIPF